MKFIIILRNPIERAYSQWNFFHNSNFVRGKEMYDKRSFEKAIQDGKLPLSRGLGVFFGQLFLVQVEHFGIHLGKASTLETKELLDFRAVYSLAPALVTL